MGAEGGRRLRVGRLRRRAAALLVAVLLAAAMEETDLQLQGGEENLPVHASIQAVRYVRCWVLLATAGRPIRLPAALLARRRIDSSIAMDGSAWADGGTAGPARRRWLIGPGSSPPTCRTQCGRCSPCRPTRVAIQPGVGPQWEYYPEVWRCKCGSKLFMP
ncbi:hypothetical protein C2845_PM18G09720 [Panicum miliaceum]|uniref:Epidermal patterning factor-like protein n=1 Tax=Panicum miliaceum TaxID=4540 RepID=A0A3L6PJX9_PANMI|nr:hypothetical protein C2845_PM18G09720 [Panicum miliaceum]